MFCTLLKSVEVSVALDISANATVSKSHTPQTLFMDIYSQLTLVLTVIFQHA